MEELQAAIGALQRAREAKLAELQAIEDALAALGALGAASDGGPKEGRPRSEDYRDLGVTAAAKRFLRESSEPQDTRSIADAILNRGLKTNSKNFIATVYATLRNSRAVRRTEDGRWELMDRPEL